MILDFVGGSYTQPINNVNAELCVNWYPKYKTNKEGNKTDKHLFPTSGLKLLNSFGGNKVRGLKEHKGVLYVVVDQTLYSYTKAGVSTTLGTIGAIERPRVEMEVNNNDELFVADLSTAYIYDITAATLTQVTDVDYPGCENAAYQDGYVFVVSGGRVYYSDVGSAGSWSANVFTPGFRADNTRAVASFYENIICFGDKTVEFYINDGSTPFSRLSRTSILLGISAPDSMKVLHDSVIFLGKNEVGGNSVYIVSKDYDIAAISPPSMTEQLNNCDVSTAFANIEYTKDGSIFYHLSITDLDKTFTYDLLTKEWHERSSLKPYTDVDGTYLYGIYRSNVSTFFGNYVIIGDIYSGSIYQVDQKTYTEGSQHIKRIRRSMIYNKEHADIALSSLEFDVNSGDGLLSGQGSDPLMMLRVSKDFGQNWSNERHLSLGTRGNYGSRVRTFGLGVSRNWVIEVSITDPVPLIINSVEANGEFGAN